MRNFAAGVGILVVVALGAYFIWTNRVKAPVAQNATSTTQTSSTTVVINTPQGSYTIEQLPDTNTTGPKTPQIYRTITFSNMVSDDQKTTIQAAAKATEDKLSKDPTNGDLWISLGTIRKMAGDYAGAQEAWKYAMALDPKIPTAYFNLADLYANFLHDPTTAESYYKKVIAIEPSNENAYGDLFTLYTSGSYKSGASAAEDILKAGIKANPDAVDLQVLLARYYKAQGRAADAKTEYDAAIANATRQKNSNLADEIQQEALSQ